jgi:hypothetical protein
MSGMDKGLCAHGYGRTGTHDGTSDNVTLYDSNNNHEKPHKGNRHISVPALLLGGTEEDAMPSCYHRPNYYVCHTQHNIGFVGWYSRSKTGPKHRTGNF